MGEASRRAARPVDRGGLPNALFVVAAIEHPPVELRGLADVVTVRFPWGSLLRGILGADPVAARGLGSLVRPGGRIEAFVSLIDRDGPAGLAERLEDRAGLEASWVELGFRVEALELVSPAVALTSGSSWAKRLVGRPDGRPTTRLVLSRDLEPLPAG